MGRVIDMLGSSDAREGALFTTNCVHKHSELFVVVMPHAEVSGPEEESQ